MLSLNIAGLEVAATIRLQKPQRARGHPRGKQQSFFQGNLLMGIVNWSGVA